MSMTDSAETATQHQDLSAEGSSQRVHQPSTALPHRPDSRRAAEQRSGSRAGARCTSGDSTPAGVGKAAIIAGVIALLIGMVFGFTMSTVGLR
jgi:hypothetical protein